MHRIMQIKYKFVLSLLIIGLILIADHIYEIPKI